jgi:hypothetical protein
LRGRPEDVVPYAQFRDETDAHLDLGKLAELAVDKETSVRRSEVKLDGVATAWRKRADVEDQRAEAVEEVTKALLLRLAEPCAKRNRGRGGRVIEYGEVAEGGERFDAEKVKDAGCSHEGGGDDEAC